MHVGCDALLRCLCFSNARLSYRHPPLDRRDVLRDRQLFLGASLVLQLGVLSLLRTSNPLPPFWSEGVSIRRANPRVGE